MGGDRSHKWAATSKSHKWAATSKSHKWAATGKAHKWAASNKTHKWAATSKSHKWAATRQLLWKSTSRCRGMATLSPPTLGWSPVPIPHSAGLCSWGTALARYSYVVPTYHGLVPPSPFLIFSFLSTVPDCCGSSKRLFY